MSNDELETGMVFNVEPSIYFDVVAVTEHGAEVLSSFQSTADELITEATNGGPSSAR